MFRVLGFRGAEFRVCVCAHRIFCEFIFVDMRFFFWTWNFLGTHRIVLVLVDGCRKKILTWIFFFARRIALGLITGAEAAGVCVRVCV